MIAIFTLNLPYTSQKSKNIEFNTNIIKKIDVKPKQINPIRCIICKNKQQCLLMLYILEEKLRFDPIEQTIASLADDNSLVTISSTGTRLLEILLLNNTKCLERDFLLVEVWEKNGLVPSGNSLNNQVSLLRKNLALLGIYDGIVTHPRIGFSGNFNTISKNGQPPSSLVFNKKSPYKIKKIILSTLPYLFIIGGYSINFRHENIALPSEYFEVNTDYNQCSLHLKSKRSEYSSMSIKKNCDEDIYILTPSKNDGESLKKFVITCGKNESSICKSHSEVYYPSI